MRLTAARKVTTVQGQTVELALLWPPHWHPEVPARISKQHLPLLGGSGCCCLLACQLLQICFTFLARFGSIFSRFWTAYRKNEIETHKSKTRGSTCVSSLFPCGCCLLWVIIVPFFLSSLFNFCQGYIDMSWNDSFATSLFVKTSVNRGFVVWRHWHPPSQVCSLGQVKPTWNEQPVWEGVQNLCDSERKHGSSVKPISQKIWFFLCDFWTLGKLVWRVPGRATSQKCSWSSKSDEPHINPSMLQLHSTGRFVLPSF